jgi:hypothetical protein
LHPGRIGAQQIHDVAAEPLAQVDVHIRMRGQVAAQHRRQELGDRGGAGEDAQVALHALRVLLQITAQVLDLVQHQPRMVGEGLARRRERHALAAAVQQLRADPLLQVLDAHARRRQRHVRALGPARETVGLGDVDEEAQVDQVEVHGADCGAATGPLAPLIRANCPTARSRSTSGARGGGNR